MTGEVKVIVVGSGSVGKTSLIDRYIREEFAELSQATILACFSSVTYTSSQTGTRLAAFIWDTAGQEEYHALTSTYFRGAHAAFVVYDCCNRASFEQLSLWLDMLGKFAPANCDLTILANKLDLTLPGERSGKITPGGQRKVSRKEGLALAKLKRCGFAEVSAKSGEEVVTAFEDVLERLSSTQFSGEAGVRISDTSNSKSSSCC